jgi:hypothetical protein
MLSAKENKNPGETKAAFKRASGNPSKSREPDDARYCVNCRPVHIATIEIVANTKVGCADAATAS